ncbi:hypothetical protein [Solibacillus cecembensis]|uniref:hypothetical protein n=1 Tax=Solibacillus cecembensis TaxID=459347 RepID=UPI003D077D06
MKKIVFVILFVLLLLGCSQKEQILDDKLQFEIQTVSEEELRHLINQSRLFTKQEIEGNYAVVVFDYKVRNGKKFHHLTVEHDFDWSAFMDQIKLDAGPKYTNGNGRSSDFNNGSFKEDSMRSIFYAKNFSDEQLQKIFEAYKLDISWQNTDGEIVEKTIPIGDSLQIKR